jgi:putative tributyrin esterase
VALIRCDFLAETLGFETTMTVVLPPGTTAPPPVLYLLHGLGDNDSAWARHTPIERLAAARGLAVVMPQVHRSFYADEAVGHRYWTFLTEELPAVAGSLFRISQAREDTFVAGLSMGGYGAFKWALRRPERFAAAAALSAPLDLAYLRETDDRPHIGEIMSRVFGGHESPGDDLVGLLGAAGPASLPSLLVRCGTEDHLIEHNRRFVAAAERAGVPLDAEFGPGAHVWDYWDAQLRTVLDWLPLKTA